MKPYYLGPEYKAWKQARQRCNNPHNQDYRYYGGRGIRFLFVDFDSFIRELGPRPSAQYSLDRWPNNDGHYEPGNCRWATVRQQRQNRRTYQIASNNKSGVRGVCRLITGLWRAYGYRNHKNKMLGTFVTRADAVAARKQWEQNA